jgi:Ran GTPase-activating protein (RanGAP) involved in mRNA processing and transport
LDNKKPFQQGFALDSHGHEMIPSTYMVKSCQTSLRQISLTINDDNMAQLSIRSRQLNRRFVKKFKCLSLEEVSHLNFQNNYMYRDKTIFRRLLQTLPLGISDLSFCWNGIDSAMSTELAMSLTNFTNLKYISLCGNPIGCQGLRILLEKGKLLSIPKVNLNDCDIGKDGLSLLAEHLPFSETKHLALKMNGIEETGARLLAKGLVNNKTLTLLHLNCNEINDVGVQALMDALCQGNSVLEELSLCANLLTFDGSQYIVNRLHQTSLQRLNLDHNYLGDEGARPFVTFLSSSSKLQVLTLNSNNLSNQTIQAFAIALTSNKTLRRLSLSGNPEVNRRGVSSFYSTLQKNQHLSSLEILEENYENHLLLEKLDHLLEKNDLRQQYMTNLDLPLRVWPHVLGTLSTDLFYFMLQGRPDLVQMNKNES